jgi:hypothetical protein
MGPIVGDRGGTINRCALFLAEVPVRQAVANGAGLVMRAARRLAAAQLVVNTSCYRARDRTAKGRDNASQDILCAGQKVDRRTRKGDQQMANKSRSQGFCDAHIYRYDGA